MASISSPTSEGAKLTAAASTNRQAVTHLCVRVWARAQNGDRARK